jgi:polygalacturonase
MRIVMLSMMAAMLLSGLSCSDVKPGVPMSKVSARVFDVRDYGAVADGTTDNATAIQKAIDDANSAGGGMVLFSGGTFLSGPLRLCSNMDLRIRAGASLKALPMDRYPVVNNRCPDFMVAQNAHDLRLSGDGTIDGQGEPWWVKFDSKAEMPGRPRLIYLSRCERVDVSGLHIQNSPMFHLVLNNTNDVTVSGVTITADGNSPNTDGIDVRGNRVFITNCDISVGDDNVAMGGPTSQVRVTNCRFNEGHGLSIGSYTRGGVSDIMADNIIFNGTDNGIRGKSERGRGGVVENLRYSNIRMTNVKWPIVFSSFYLSKPKDPNTDGFEPVGKLTPIWRNATFTNITIQAAEKRYGIVLWGTPEMPIENFQFNSVNVRSPRGNRLFHVKNISFSNDCRFEATDTGAPFDITDAVGVRMPGGEMRDVPMKKAETVTK